MPPVTWAGRNRILSLAQHPDDCASARPPGRHDRPGAPLIAGAAARAPRTQVQLLVISYSLASFPDLRVFLSIPILAFFTARRPAPCPIARLAYDPVSPTARAVCPRAVPWPKGRAARHARHRRTGLLAASNLLCGSIRPLLSSVLALLLPFPQLSNPFGHDAIDFEVEKILRAIHANAMSHMCSGGPDAPSRASAQHHTRMDPRCC